MTVVANRIGDDVKSYHFRGFHCLTRLSVSVHVLKSLVSLPMHVISKKQISETKQKNTQYVLILDEFSEVGKTLYILHYDNQQTN